MGGIKGNDSASRDNEQGSISLDELREEIEEIDREILESIARRTYIGESIAEAKNEQDMEIDDPDREEEVITRVRGIAENLELDPDRVEEVFRVLIELNKAEQREIGL